MRVPRKGILIRLFIYVPLIAFFGWQAYQTQCASEAPRLEKEAVPTKAFPEGTRRTHTLPDGSKIEYIELTPEQARKALGDDAVPDDLDAERDAKATADEPNANPSEAVDAASEHAEASDLDAKAEPPADQD